MDFAGFILTGFLVAVSPVPIISIIVWLVSRNPKIVKITLACIGLQLFVYVGSILVLLSIDLGPLPGSSSAGFGYIIFGITVLAGILGYPLAYMFVMKREGWKVASSTLLAFYFIIILLFATKPALEGIERKFNIELVSGENFIFYGRLLDQNFAPIHGAILKHSNCRWTSSNPIITNSDGIFNIRGYCAGRVLIMNIYDAEGSLCNIIARGIEYGISKRHSFISLSPYEENIKVKIRSNQRGENELDDISTKENSASSPFSLVCKIRKNEQQN